MLRFKNVNIVSIFFLVILIPLTIHNSLSVWYIIAIVGLWLYFASMGSFFIQWNYFINSKNKNTTIKKSAVALTFDDGPNEKYTPKVLELLKKHQVKATFFCIGKNIEDNPNLLKRIISDGHVIGNHSYKHTNNYGFLATSKIISDIIKTNQLVKKITGLNLNLFRPPFGVTNPLISKAIRNLNMHSIGWSIRSYDTIAKDPKKVLTKIKKQLNNGDVILLHDNNEVTIDILVQLLPFLKEEKIETQSVDELFKIDAYV